MKKALVILLAVVLFRVSASAQINDLGGELRFDYRYQDYRSGDVLTTYISKNPLLNLHTRGSILSPRLATFSLFTSLNAIFATNQSESFSYSGSQYSWNRYNLSLNLLPYSPVRLKFGTRENSYDMMSESDLNSDRTGDRQQEQRAEMTVQQVPWLPSLSLSYVRTRSFSTLGNPYDFVGQTYSFIASGASDSTGSYNISAVRSDFREGSSGGVDKFLTLQFSASRSIGDGHEVGISTEYNKYDGLSTISGSASYSGSVSEKVRMATGVSGSSAIAQNSKSVSFGLSQSFSYFINQFFQSSCSMSGFAANSQRSGFEITYKSMSSSANLQHHRTIYGVSFLNGLSLGFSKQLNATNFSSFSAAFSSGASRMIGFFSLSGDYVLSYTKVKNVYAYDLIGNSGGISFSGTVARQIQTQSSIRYSEDHYLGTESLFRNNGSLIITQRFNGSMVAIIPLKIGVSGSFNRYLSGITGNTYAWSVSVSTNSFFVRGLSADYVYSNNYDPYYQREIVDHTGSLSIGWRALAFSSRFRYASFPVHVREIQITLSRPF